VNSDEPVMGSNAVANANVDGLVLLEATRVATAWLATHRDRINALNVFPVPDGDTGTNMLLTLREAVAAGEEAARTTTEAGVVAAALARGAFVGARGNSGVILCQMIGGFATAIAGCSIITGPDVAAALAGAQAQAYRAVLDPVEGTMLTVLRVAAEHAAAAVAAAPGGEPDLEAVLGAALEGAEEALATTPELLDILRAANVVDAGGQGVVHFLEGLTRFAAGATEPAPAAEPTTAHSIASDMAFLDTMSPAHGDEAYGYCINFVVLAEGRLDFEAARTRLGDLGRSAEVIGDERALRVHIHAENPGPILEYAAGLGPLDSIEIDNMELQTKRLVDERVSARATSPTTPAALSLAEVGPAAVAVLSIAPGPGLVSALRSMGAAAVIGGGQAMNPSTAEILAGIDAVAAKQIIVLPNNPNIQLAAEQAAELTDKQVQVVASRSVPQGLAALATLSPDGPLEENVRKMTRALAQVRTVEVTHATRDATIDDVNVRQGQAIGFVDDQLVASGDELVAVATAAVVAADVASAELVTIFTGDGASPDVAAALRDALLTKAPALEVEIIEGGQPHYPFVIAVE
jgi:DAK2 domain fusion protein YloV